MIRLFRVLVPMSVVTLLLSEAVLIFGCYLFSSYHVLSRNYDVPMFLFEDNGLVRILVITLTILMAMYFTDLYTEIQIRQRIRFLQQLSLVLGSTFICQALIGYIKRDWIVPRWVAIEGSAFVLVGLFLWRLLFTSTLWKAVRDVRILFLGSSPIVLTVVKHLQEHPHLGLLPIGNVGEDTEPGAELSGTPLLGSVNELREVVARTSPDRIVVCMSERRNRFPVQDLLDLRFRGIQIEEVATLYEAALGRVCTREIRPSQLIFSAAGLGPQKHSLKLQRVYSVGLAVIGLVLVTPIMAIVAVLVRLSSPGPALIRQRRVGLNSKVFVLYKFRSMYADAEARTGAVWAKSNDPRITPLGYWLRKLRLDELPQLFNVLRGEMSIVGPRPERPEFVDVLSAQIPYYSQRHCVMPGITGWAQINYKYGDTIEDTITKLEYDLYYIKHISFSLDLYIMFHTAKTMLLLRGAQ